jgi:hypothetical protein
LQAYITYISTPHDVPVKTIFCALHGMCCTWRAKLVEGEVTMLRNFSLESWDEAQPRSSRVVLVYDAI